MVWPRTPEVTTSLIYVKDGMRERGPLAGAIPARQHQRRLAAEVLGVDSLAATVQRYNKNRQMYIRRSELLCS